MPEYPIGRIATVDEETQEQTPIDVRTRAEAVSWAFCSAARALCEEPLPTKSGRIS